MWLNFKEVFSVKKIIKLGVALSLIFVFTFSALPEAFLSETFDIKKAEAAATWKSTGTYVSGNGGTLTPAIPTAASGDMMIMSVGAKPYNGAITVNNGWVSIGSATDGTVAAAADVGSMKTEFFYKIHTGTETNPTVTLTSPSVNGAVIIVFQKGASDVWETPVGSGGGDATAGTGFSVTASANPGITSGDMLVGYAAIRSDAGTQSAIGITATGATVGAFTEAPAADLATTAGSDMAMSGGYRSVTAGTASAAPVYASTLAAAHTGSAFIVRLRANTPITTTLADGTDPTDSTVAPSAAITDLDAFTLQTSSGTDSVTGLTVTLTGANSFESLSEVRITSDNGATLYFGAAANPASNTVTFSAGTPIPVSTTATQFKVRITPKTHANMPVPPGLLYSVGGTVTAFTSTNTQAGTDATTPATITVHNLSPNNATLLSGTAGDTKNTINWTTSNSTDFNTTSGSVVYRWASGTAGAEVPAEGSTATIGAANGTATTACVVSSALSTALSKIDGTGGSVGECTTTALTNGQAYTYKVFQKDTSGNYDVGVLIGTFTPAVGVAITSYTNTTETGLNYAGACAGCGARIGGGAGFRQSITITGSGFGADPGVGFRSTGTNNVKIGTKQIADANVTAWSATSITFLTDTSVTGDTDTDWGTNFGGASALVVTAGGGVSSGLNFYVFPQVTSITSCDKAGFPVGSGAREYDATDAACPNGLKDGQVKLVGTRFGTGATGGWVRILGCDVTTCASPTGTVNVDSWANELVQVQVPTIIADTVNSGSLIVQQGAGSGFKTHTYTASGFLIFPRITGFTPTSASEGSAVAVDGNHFCQTGTCPTVFLGGTNDVVFTSAVSATTFTSWTATAMTTAVPTGAVTGNVVLKSNSNASNAKSFSVVSNTPADPTSLNQWINSGLTTAIAVGGVASSTLYLSQSMAVPGITGGTLYPQFEYQLIGTPFGCGAGVCAGATTGAGWPGAGPTTGTTSISVADGVYHWQARTKHTKTAVDYYSAWVPFGANVETATDFQKDTTAPAVTSVSSGTPGTNTATITWNTSGETSTTRIEYDTAGTFTGGYNCASTAECTTLVATLVNAHSVALSNLNSGTTYHYRVRSMDSAGNETIDPPTGDYTFTTSSTLSPSKTTRFHIVGNTASISGASNSYTFSVHMPENATTTRSAFVELKGIFLVGGTPAIGMTVNSEATSTYAFPSGSRYSLKILHPVSSVNISPDTNTLTIAPGAGNGFYVSSADIYVNYTYTP